MTIFDKFIEAEQILPPDPPGRLTLRAKLLFILIPSVIIILMIAGHITYLASTRFLNQALERTSRIQVKAAAHEIESLLARCTQNLLFLAHNYTDPEMMRKNLAEFEALEHIDFRDIGFIAQNEPFYFHFVSYDNKIIQLKTSMISDINPSPRLLMDHLANLKDDEVWISNIIDVEYPFPTESNPNKKIRSKVIYFATPCFSMKGEKKGYLLLSIDVRNIRNILSVYNSPRSPIWAFKRTQEIRFFYVFDLDGWMLFESEDPDKPEAGLSTNLAREEYHFGTLGKPNFESAFRPASNYLQFWKMISDIKDDKFDLIEIPKGIKERSEVKKDYYLSYSPIHYQGRVLGGVAYVDRTRVILVSGYKHLNMMLIISMVSTVIVSIIIYVLSGWITKPILRLVGAVNDIQKNRKLVPIDIPNAGYETHLLQNAINRMMDVVTIQMTEIKQKDLKIQAVANKEKIELISGLPYDGIQTNGILPEIKGFGNAIELLKSNIVKAASVDADVLIIGDTGTGKQLTAEAIHNHSRRAAQPFISVNCGELSENLLFDSLFGHVKGAFTEAKSDRKGAFIEADGGTLFLDEIQNSSSNVQQALLRAVSLRKIKQLGSDTDHDVDVRLICATNIDLRLLVDNGQFRSDLYYRLKVLTVETPRLKDHKESIPVLVDHCLRQLRTVTNREELGVSKGALEKMKQYDWPGNVRELMNSMTRAAVMAENDIIQAEDVIMDWDYDMPGKTSGFMDEHPSGNGKKTPDGIKPSSNTPNIPGHLQLNERQIKVYPFVMSNKSITRKEYQEQVGGNISSRTAVYDLQDLVQKGVLDKEGNGPTTRYVLSKL